MMKRLAIILIGCWALSVFAQVHVIITPPGGGSGSGTNSTIGSGKFFIVTNATGNVDTNKLKDWTDLLYAPFGSIGGDQQTNRVAFTNDMIWFDAKGAALAATNGLGASAFKATSFFDLAGAATAATNGFPWGSLYDAAGLGATRALEATNALGASAYKATSFFDLSGSATAATNGFPWGSLYDAAGVGATRSLEATNALGASAYKATSFFDLSGSATAVTNDATLLRTTGSGAGLTGLNPTNLSSGTIPTNTTVVSAGLALSITNTGSTNLATTWYQLKDINGNNGWFLGTSNHPAQ